MIKVLIVDDEKDVEFLFRLQFRKELRAEKIKMHFAFSGEEALTFMKTLDPFDIVLLMSDINMPGMTGLELIKAAKQLFPGLRIVMITAYNDEHNRKVAANNGASAFLTKPVDFDTIRELIFTGKSEQA